MNRTWPFEKNEEVIKKFLWNPYRANKPWRDSILRNCEAFRTRK